MSRTRTTEVIGSDAEYEALIGAVPPEAPVFNHPTQETAAEAVDVLYDVHERLAMFVLRNPLLFAQFHALCVEAEKAAAIAKEAMQAVEPAGPFKHRDVQRKAAPQSVEYDATKLPPEILRRPGIVKSIDWKTLDKLGVGELAAYASILRDARTETTGTPSVVIPLKTPDTARTRHLLANT